MTQGHWRFMAQDKKQIFIGVIGDPYESDLCTSLFRMVDAAITEGHEIVVWTCCGATSLTAEALGETKPRNLMDIGAGHACPSTAHIVRGLIDEADGSLRWLVCRYCAEERGVTCQIEGVQITAPFKLIQHMNQADVAMIMGQC